MNKEQEELKDQISKLKIEILALLNDKHTLEYQLIEDIVNKNKSGASNSTEMLLSIGTEFQEKTLELIELTKKLK